MEATVMKVARVSTRFSKSLARRRSAWREERHLHRLVMSIFGGGDAVRLSLLKNRHPNGLLLEGIENYIAAPPAPRRKLANYKTRRRKQWRHLHRRQAEPRPRQPRPPATIVMKSPDMTASRSAIFLHSIGQSTRRHRVPRRPDSACAMLRHLNG
jgi:hypothetical protein